LPARKSLFKMDCSRRRKEICRKNGSRVTVSEDAASLLWRERECGKTEQGLSGEGIRIEVTLPREIYLHEKR